MDFVTLLVMALALSMDAFAVSISNAMCIKGITGKQMLVTSVSFGLFQGVMPIIGFFAGRLMEGFIQAVDHWVALVLLGFIGGKMLVEGIRAMRQAEDCPVEGTMFTVRGMLVQAVATSIDALAVGISLAVLSVNIWFSAGIIAATTLVCCLLGGVLGKRFSTLLGDWAQVLGGLLLVGIGLKIFIEHMVTGA